jgi:hypothetical protein
MDYDKPDAEFWRAILEIHNRFFKVALDEYTLGGMNRRKHHIYDSFSIVSWWLDIALTRDWLEESDS